MIVETGKKYYSLSEIARSWGLSEKTVRNYIKANVLKAIRINDRFYISEDESARYQREGSIIKLMRKPILQEAR